MRHATLWPAAISAAIVAFAMSLSFSVFLYWARPEPAPPTIPTPTATPVVLETRILIVPPACLGALSAAEDLTGILIRWPAMVTKAWMAGLRVNTATMNETAAEAEDLAEQQDERIDEFRRLAAICRNVAD